MARKSFDIKKTLPVTRESPGEHDDDAVGFAEFLGAEDEGGVAPGAGFAHGCLRSRYMLGRCVVDAQ